jgi:hypothetical protein
LIIRPLLQHKQHTAFSMLIFFKKTMLIMYIYIVTKNATIFVF